MVEHMKAMQAMRDQMMNARTPTELQALMDEHMKTMQEGMAMMKGIKGMGGMHGKEGMPGMMPKAPITPAVMAKERGESNICLDSWLPTSFSLPTRETTIAAATCWIAAAYLVVSRATISGLPFTSTMGSTVRWTCGTRVCSRIACRKNTPT